MDGNPAGISVRTLDCGLPLILEHMPGVRSVGVSWLLPAGSATDPADRQGLSALWSELIYRGAGDLDSRGQADAMDRLGLSRSSDVSTFHLRLGFTLLGDRLLDALPIITDLIRRPRMEDDSIEPARDLAIQSIESLADDPQERTMLTLKERHAPPPLNRSGLGTIEGLQAITRADLLEGWARQVRPMGSILSMAGDLTARGGGGDAIAGALNKLLAGWSGAAAAVAPGTTTTRGSYHHITDESAQVQIALMHEGPPEPSPDSRLERVIGSVLSGGMAARLFTEVREKRGLCYSVSESYAAERDYGRCVGYVGTTPERAQESLDVMMAELDRINTPAGAITSEEFDRAMIGIRSGLIFSGESTGARAGALAGDQHRLGRPRSLQEILQHYATITLDEVNGYAARRSLGEVTVVTLGKTALVRKN